MPTSGKTVLVRFDRVYGNVVCYPDNENAQTIAAIARKKTLSPENLEQAKKLGFEIVISLGSAKVLNEFLNQRLEVVAP